MLGGLYPGLYAVGGLQTLATTEDAWLSNFILVPAIGRVAVVAPASRRLEVPPDPRLVPVG
jgi:hypothetical protein